MRETDMAIRGGTEVRGHLTNKAMGRLEFTGTVVDIYRSNGTDVVNVMCSDGIERSALLENVIALDPKLTPSMVRTLKNLVTAGQVPSEGTRAMNEKGCTYPALQALLRRGLVVVVGTGERLPSFRGGTFERTVFRPTNAGRAAAEYYN